MLTNEFDILLLKLVKQYVGYFPYVNLHATVSPITRTVLKVRASAEISQFVYLFITFSYVFTYVFSLGGPEYNSWILVERSLPRHVTTMVDYCWGVFGGYMQYGYAHTFTPFFITTHLHYCIDVAESNSFYLLSTILSSCCAMTLFLAEAASSMFYSVHAAFLLIVGLTPASPHYSFSS